MSNKPELLVLDIDGTLVNRAGQISESDLAAVRAARAAGVKVALCTGRVYTTARRVLEQLELDGFHIFFDGALVCDYLGVEEVYCRPLPPEIARRIGDLALERQVMLDFYSLHHFYVMYKSWRSDIRKDYFGLDAEVADFKTLWQRERLIKGTLVYNNAADEKITRGYLDLIRDSLNFSWSTIPAYPGYHFINIIDKGVSKGQAVEALAAHYGIDLNSIMAIGDGANDIPLLSIAGIAVAMQNAPETLLDESDFVTADVEHNGVAQAIRRFIL